MAQSQRHLRSVGIRIKMTRGNRNADYTAANKIVQKYIPGFTKPDKYTWHHMDHLIVNANGDAWCTMHLVETASHATVGMTHSGAVAFDVATLDEIIEVKATFNSVKEDQFTKLLDKSADNFCNPNQKKIILYVDKPLKEATDAQVRMIDRIKSQGVIFINSLEELEKILK